MKTSARTMLVALLVAVLPTACEKAMDVDQPTDPVVDEDCNVVLRVSAFDLLPFDEAASATRTATDVSALCTRINFVVCDAQGTKVKAVAQKQGDVAFGTAAMSLAAGTYQVAIVAHNSDGTATMSDLQKITFPNNIVSDTFYYYGTIVVGDEPQTYDLTLRRAVAMFRLVLTEELPQTVARLKFYYTGGSSTFSAVTGYGSVQSRQTVTLPVRSGQLTYDVYTFPHEERDELKMTITALDATDATVVERVFEGVPVVRNQITRYTGSLTGTGGDPASSSTIRLTADPDWGSTTDDTF